MSCSRVNPQAGCNPIKDVVLSFASPVSRATILAATLDTADGQRLTPRIDDDAKNDDWLTTVRFTGPLPHTVHATPRRPSTVPTPNGRRRQPGRPACGERGWHDV